MKTSFDFTARGKYKNLAAPQQKARFALIDEVLRKKAPITISQGEKILHRQGIKRPETTLQELVAKHLISLNDAEEIAYLYPVSAEKTNHRVRLADGREFYAMCAIDALGTAATFGVDAEIFSRTKDTEETVHGHVSPGGAPTMQPNDLMVSYYDSWAEGCVNY